MIAHEELLGLGADPQAIEAALMEEPLASAASHTVAAFCATTDMLRHVGDLAVDYGLGKPLTIFQSLLVTYRSLIGTQAALAATAQEILATAERIAAGE